MDLAYEICRAVSWVTFLGYGLACLFGRSMESEFERFGLARFRRLVGWLEVLGALGLLASYALPAVVLVAAGGLTLLMLLGVATRVRVGDSLLATLPALTLLVMNGFVTVYALSSGVLA